MIQAAQLAPGQRVLDVGCGSGAPARRLASEQGVEVLGITTSQIGVETATLETARAGVSGVTFEQRDGTANGLPDESFDRVWVLESSHLMPDRQALVSECARVLKPGGRVALCDLIRRREIPFAELRERKDDFAILRAAFGAARMDTLDQYAGLMENAGLVVDQRRRHHDRDPPDPRSLARHGRRAPRGGDRASSASRASRPSRRRWGFSKRFWRDGTLGYGLISATKPG